MARSDQYEHQNKLFMRFEIEGEALTITETERTTSYRGKDWPTRRVRWKGLHRIRFGDEEYLADESMVFDSGPKLGVSVVVTRHREVPFTAEERAAGRANINRVMRDLFGFDVIWPDETKEKSPPLTV